MNVALISIACLLPLEESPKPAHAVFEDVTQRTGIAFTHVSGSSEKDFIFEVNGSGVALFDSDGDEDLDIYLVNGSRLELKAGEKPPSDALYRNEGGLRFTDVTGAARLGDSGWSCGASAADVDNDGDLDLYVTNWGPNVLYLNHGDGTFDRAQSSGAEDPGMSTSASFGDFNSDGLVDLFVANYVEIDPATAKRRADGACLYKQVPIFCGPGGLTPAQDHFYVNLGSGKFRDATAEWGVKEAGPAYGLGTLTLDVNRDGWLDLVVANDTQRNFCFLNQRGQRFQEAGLYLGLAYNDYGVAQAGMGLASACLRGRPLDDIFLTTFEDDTNTLYVNDGEGLYSDGTHAAGLAAESYPYLGWGTFFFDAENDGDLDLFVANGHVAPQADSMRSSAGYRQRNHLYLNDGSGKFTLCTSGCGQGLDVKQSSRGAACGDLDGDGDLDIVVSNIDAPPTVLENRTAPGNAWVALKLVGTRSNRSAIGARVTLEEGGVHRERTIQSGMSFASQCELTTRFGLGKTSEAGEVLVEWPSGLRERFPAPPLRSTTKLVEGTGTPAARKEPR